MTSFLNKVFDYIKRQDISISQYLLGLLGIIFVRYLLEVISSPTPNHNIPLDPSTIIHYGLSYIATVLGLACIAIFLTKDRLNVLKVILFGSTLLWLGPTLDLILTLGKGSTILYIFSTPKQLLVDFFNFFGPQVTLGLRIEIFVIILLAAAYVWASERNVKKTILAGVLTYIFIFFIFAIPSLIYIFGNTAISPNPNINSVISTLTKDIFNSNIVYNTIDPTLSFGTPFRAFELGFNKLISQIYIILSFIFGAFLFFKTEKDKFITIIKNSRPERVLFYFTLVAIGMGHAFKLGLGEASNWIDYMSIIVLAISWYSAWMFAVHTNDVVDESIDKISNPERPIPEKTMHGEEMLQTSYIWLALSLLGSYSVGYFPFILNLTFTMAYFVYSCPPLRYKRIPILSSFLISIACLSSVMAGFFFLAKDKTMTDFPALLSIGIILIFTLATNIRDIKDIEGDKKEGIYTLPVIFANHGRKIVAGMFALSFLLMPYFFSSYTLYIFAIPASIVGYFIVVRNPYREKYIFYLYFVFILATIISTGSFF